MKFRLVGVILLLSLPFEGDAQVRDSVDGVDRLNGVDTVKTVERIVPIMFGDMEQWLERTVKESFLIGGKEKTIYEIAPADDNYKINTPYKPTVSNWASSSVYARVSGVRKASVSVFPERESDGNRCVRLETIVDGVSVLGVVNIEVLATGSIFLGELVEPVTNTDNPQSKLMMGIPIKDIPKGMIFDYKVDPAKDRVRISGFRTKRFPGINGCEAAIILQHRYEDHDGNVYAKRVATAWERFYKKELTWQRNYRMDLSYGDISSLPGFKPFQDIITGENTAYTRNSKGEIKPINEGGWATTDEKATHLIVRFSSGYGGAYIGSVGSKFWIDNVKLIY